MHGIINKFVARQEVVRNPFLYPIVANTITVNIEIEKQILCVTGRYVLKICIFLLFDTIAIWQQYTTQGPFPSVAASRQKGILNRGSGG